MRVMVIHSKNSSFWADYDTLDDINTIWDLANKMDDRNIELCDVVSMTVMK